MRTPSGECDVPAAREKCATNPSDAGQLNVEQIPAAKQRDSGFRWIIVTRASRQPDGSARSCVRNRCSLTSLRSADYQPYALPSRGPRKYQRINPNTGRSTTAIVQISFFSLEAELWKILIIAQISPASISTPHRLWYPKFIIFGSFRIIPQPSIRVLVHSFSGANHQTNLALGPALGGVRPGREFLRLRSPGTSPAPPLPRS